MKYPSSILAALLLIAPSKAEDVTFAMQFPAGSQTVSSPSITLNEGETAKLAYVYGAYAYVECVVGDKTIPVPCTVSNPVNSNTTIMNPIVITGPATLTVKAGGPSSSGGSGLVSLSISRIGTASNPASIPQEAGSKFDVILESSSDLENWIGVNPGEYTGTEARRFFRTRIVKKDPVE